VQTEKAIVDKTSSEELLIENNEPQLAGEE
jgi:hypothetical protein